MRVTIKKLVEVLQRLDRCENMAQVCHVFDTMPTEIREKVAESIEGDGEGSSRAVRQ
jgi:hypothetical protein